MPKNSKVYAIIVLVFSVLVSFFIFNGRQNLVTIVYDGDTFELADGQKIRLWGIDAPEKGMCGGQEAKDYLTKLILNKRVVVKKSLIERYNRPLSLVYLDGELVNANVAKAGWAVYDGSGKPEKMQLSAANKYARTNKTGVFGPKCYQKENPINPDCNIKGNMKKSDPKKVYHLPYCREYDSVSIELYRGEKWFCTEEEAIKAGYVRASHCD